MYPPKLKWKMYWTYSVLQPKIQKIFWTLKLFQLWLGHLWLSFCHGKMLAASYHLRNLRPEKDCRYSLKEYLYFISGEPQANSHTFCWVKSIWVFLDVFCTYSTLEELSDYFFLKYGWFTTFLQFLLYSKVTQSHTVPYAVQ